MRKKKNGFTLIELIAVLVILAIIALITSPLVMNTVRKVKDSANKRSVDGYGRAVELAIATYLVDHYNYPTNLDDLKVEYTGNKVVCNVKTLNEDGSIYLSECSVKGIEVKDTSTEDGWYHYGKTTKVPLEEPVVYQEYNVGDVVTYNGIEFYVIEASDERDDRVTMLKATPLTVDEVNTYGGVGTDNNHVNMYATSNTTSLYYQTAYDFYGHGGMAYYSSSTCGYNGFDGCTTNYDASEVKYVVDAWSNDKLKSSDLAEDSIGYRTRLLTLEDLTNNLGYVLEDDATNKTLNKENALSWVYNTGYWYWTMSLYEDSAFHLWDVNHNYGMSDNAACYDYGGVVRPVITLLKSAI